MWISFLSKWPPFNPISKIIHVKINELFLANEDDDGDGLTKDEANQVQKNLENITNELECQLTLLRVKEISGGKETRDYLIRKRLEQEADFW